MQEKPTLGPPPDPFDAEALRIIADASRLIVEFTKATSAKAFMTDAKTRSAVTCQLLVLGEAARRLSSGFHRSHKDIDWQAITSTCANLMIHGFDIPAGDIWIVATDIVPGILAAIEPCGRAARG